MFDTQDYSKAFIFVSNEIVINQKRRFLQSHYLYSAENFS